MQAALQNVIMNDNMDMTCGMLQVSQSSKDAYQLYGTTRQQQVNIGLSASQYNSSFSKGLSVLQQFSNMTTNSLLKYLCRQCV